MGNKFGRRKHLVDEKYTKPQGLYQIKDVDYKKLRKLIIESKLAPCYPGGDDCDYARLEECPICFLYYPTLNRSRCCTKSICTECFLQMKNPNSTRPTQCPFCKTSNYAVEYRGVKSKEEKGIEQIEEQKVIEAKIRMQQQQIRDEEERQHRKEEGGSFRRPPQVENHGCSTSGGIDSVDVVPSQDLRAIQLLRQPQNTRQNRDDEFDMDLEDIMVMEAIWLSIQENGRAGQSSSSNAITGQITPRDHYRMSPSEGPGPMAASSSPSSSSPSSSPSGGLACAIAALAERQQLNGELSTTYTPHVSHLDMLPSSSNSRSSAKRVKKNQRNSINISNDFQHEDILPQASYARRNSKRVKNIQRKHSRDRAEEWEYDHGSMIAEAGTTYASSNESDDGENGGGYCGLVPPPYSDDGGFQSSIISNSVIPESFDEQMMLAMAVSIAEARARTTAQGVAWP